MNVQQQCEKLKAQAEKRLGSASTESERSEVLMDTFYELSRTVLSDIGKPTRAESYLAGQNAVLELIGYLALALIRDPLQNSRAVAVLVEVAEGTADPVLQRKLYTYAAELRARLDAAAVRQRRDGRWSSALFAVGALLAFAGMYYVVPTGLLQQDGTTKQAEAAQQEFDSAAVVQSAPATLQAVEAAAPRAAVAAPEAPATQLAQAEQRPHGEVTKVRVAGNQVFVPVTLRNAGQSVRVQLLLDTGASRTALRDTVADRLGIDLSRAKVSVVELADGRELRSHRATVELVSVGPQGAAGLEVELFPYGGGREGDGLLGMDFLGRCRYQIDMENEVIRWY